jgi:hypothetical protein
VIGYGNVADLNNVWPNKPPGLSLGGHGQRPQSADGLTAQEYARACGITATEFAPPEVAL